MKPKRQIKRVVFNDQYDLEIDKKPFHKDKKKKPKSKKIKKLHNKVLKKKKPKIFLQENPNHEQTELMDPIFIHEEKPSKKKKKKKDTEKLFFQEENILKKKKKSLSKRLFNPKDHEERKRKRDEINERLKEIYDNYGEKKVKRPEPPNNQTLWDFVVKDVITASEYIQKKRKYFIFMTRKLSKLAVITLKNINSTRQQKENEEQKKILKIAETCGRIVQRDYWRNVNKIIQYDHHINFQKRQKESQQKRLQSLVSRQLKLSTKMADYLNKKNRLDDREKESEKKADRSVSDKKKLLKNGKGKSSEALNTMKSKEADGMSSNESANEEDDMLMEGEEGEDYELSETESEEPEQMIENTKKKQIIVCLNKIDGNYSFSEIITKEVSIDEQRHSVEELSLILQSLQPQGNTLNSSLTTIQQPFLLKHELREYQLIGLNWLATLHQKRINGILADEMGLGKTIQTISLLAYLAAEKGVWGPHLIVVPTSIMVNWEIEFMRWCPAFKILTYFGSAKERKLKRSGWSKANFCHVCITSYKIVTQDQKIFRRKRWYYMILDEAQLIKNFKSQRWQTLLNFNSKHRLLLTGTPLQNEISELWSLMHFLMPNIFESHTDFKEWFSVPMQHAIQKNLPINKEIIQKLHSILRPFLLRRLKKDVEKQLPTKTEYIIKASLSRRQRYLYDEFINKENTKKSMRSQDFIGLMNILMQLKKVCNHPDLFEPRHVESPLLFPSLKIVVSSIVLLSAMKHCPSFVFLFTNEFSNYTQYEVALILKLAPRASSEFEVVKKIESEHYGSFSRFYRKWNDIEVDEKKRNFQRICKYNKKTIDPVPLIYGQSLVARFEFGKNDIYNEEGLLTNLIMSIKQRLDSYKYVFNEFLFNIPNVMARTPILVTNRYNNYFETQLSKFEDNRRPLLKLLKPFHYISIRQKLSFPNKKMTVYDCGKLNKMMELLKMLKSKGHKALIFTQMSKMLDVFEFALNYFNFTYVRLDGSTRPDMRQRIVERFNNDQRIFVFISSTRSGGIGLNLVGANVVIFYDTDWNPAMDKQAQDRCHRIGQTKNVSIYRLISEYTIEENILLKSIQKRMLDEYIMEEGKFNTDFFQKFNIKELLGDMLPSLKEDPDKNLSKITVKDYEKALEQVEDQDDIVATKKASTEEMSYMMEGGEDNLIKFHEGKKKNDEDEDQALRINQLPGIYQYGIRYFEFLNKITDNIQQAYFNDNMDVENEGFGEISEEKPENQDTEEKEVSEPEEFERSSGEQSADENNALDKRKAIKLYLNQKLYLNKNFFV